MNITAIIVTYNRSELLRECINAIRTMSARPSKIIIVDNASTDGTAQYLNELGSDPLFKVATLEKNAGGAGGFAHGIRLAMQEQCDWVWIMDDDTIPQHDTLAKLCDKIGDDPTIGFASSRVIWTDGADHIMNIPKFTSAVDERSGCQLLRSASFVSIMIKKDVVRAIGLPYKEFFIWHDDAEYTQRITQSGKKGIYVPESVTIHKTKENYGPAVDTAPISTAWKFYYGQRNSMFINRQKYGNGILFMIKELNHLRLNLHKANKRPSSERKTFKKQILRGFWDGLSFKPEIEYVQ